MKARKYIESRTEPEFVAVVKHLEEAGFTLINKSIKPELDSIRWRNNTLVVEYSPSCEEWFIGGLFLADLLPLYRYYVEGDTLAVYNWQVLSAVLNESVRIAERIKVSYSKCESKI